MKLNRLRGRKSSERLIKDGKVWKGKTLVIRYEEGLPRNQRINTVQQGLFVGTLASSRLHKSAVKRNRMRRRCKEALRRYVKDLGSVPTMQLLLMPRSSSLTCDFAEIENDVRAFLSYVS